MYLMYINMSRYQYTHRAYICTTFYEFIYKFSGAVKRDERRQFSIKNFIVYCFM